jgi:predicted dehydrogenase
MVSATTLSAGTVTRMSSRSRVLAGPFGRHRRARAVARPWSSAVMPDAPLSHRWEVQVGSGHGRATPAVPDVRGRADALRSGRHPRGHLTVDRLRLGVVGCGAVAELYHLPALLASAEVELTTFVDPDLARARRLADRAPGAAVLADCQGLADRVDAVLLTAPNALHAPLGVPLLHAGVHLLVEKPMGRTAAECDTLIAAAEAGGAVLAVGHDFRHFPVARFAHRLFAAGGLGAVRRVDVRQSAGGRWPYASPAALSPESGGGVLLDFGVHLLDLLLWWLGDLTVVSMRDDSRGGIETECELQLRHAGGASVVLELSRSRDLRDTVVVECDGGTVEVGVFEPAVVRVTPPAGPVLEGAVPDAELAASGLRTVFGRQLAEFVHAVRGEPSAVVTGHEGRRVVALTEACYAVREPWRMPWDHPVDPAFAPVIG